METEITFLGGRVETFEANTEIKLTQYGVQVEVREADDLLRVLFPWAQIERITQRGPAVSAAYTY
jgi:hypothetical protein